MLAKVIMYQYFDDLIPEEAGQMYLSVNFHNKVKEIGYLLIKMLTYTILSSGYPKIAVSLFLVHYLSIDVCLMGLKLLGNV